MNSLLPDKAPEAARRKRARYVPRLSEDPDTRSAQIGIGATILAHVLLFSLLPNKLDNDMVGSFKPQHMGTKQKTFQIQIAPDAFPVLKNPPKPPPMKFVEVNPDAPENEPDKTNNFGAQNQQAAQEQKAKVTGGDRPEMEGRKDIESSQVVSGRLLEQQPPPEPFVPPQPETKVAEKASQATQRERNPLPGFEKFIGTNPNNYGSNGAKIAPHPEDLKEKVDGSPNVNNETAGTAGSSVVVDRNHPRPRPQLERRARPALFAENKIGTANIGPAAVDARWSNYGVYLQKMMEAVQMHWEKMIIEGRTYPASGSVVTVKFIMDSDGVITRVLSVEGGMSGPQAEGYCVSAITRASPYGKWSEDMVAALGKQQEMTFAFYYQ